MFVSATARAHCYMSSAVWRARNCSKLNRGKLCFLHHELASFEDPIKLCKNLYVLCKDDKVKCICLCEALNTFA